jgi:hypothetical protein
MFAGTNVVTLWKLRTEIIIAEAFMLAGTNMVTLWKLRTEIHLLPKVKSYFRGTDFHESGSRRINFCGRLRYQIISKSDENFRNIGEILFKPVSK